MWNYVAANIMMINDAGDNDVSSSIDAVVVLDCIVATQL